MIFIFIAGTYTPFCVLLLDRPHGDVMLAVVWGGRAARAWRMKLVWPHAPRWVSAPLYLALGWVAVAVLPDILHAGGVTALVLLLAGGALYSVGAVFYALRRPNPWPTVFGHHEFFHACTLVAASATTSPSTSRCSPEPGCRDREPRTRAQSLVRRLDLGDFVSSRTTCDTGRPRPAPCVAATLLAAGSARSDSVQESAPISARRA